MSTVLISRISGRKLWRNLCTFVKCHIRKWVLQHEAKAAVKFKTELMDVYIMYSIDRDLGLISVYRTPVNSMWLREETEMAFFESSLVYIDCMSVLLLLGLHVYSTTAKLNNTPTL